MARRNPYVAVGSAHVTGNVAGAKKLWDAWRKDDHGLEFEEYAKKSAPRVYYAMKAYAKGESLRDENPMKVKWPAVKKTQKKIKRAKAKLKKLNVRYRKLSKQWEIATHQQDMAERPAQSRKYGKKAKRIDRQREKIEAKITYVKSTMR